MKETIVLFSIVGFVFWLAWINNDPVANQWVNECIMASNKEYQQCVLSDGVNCAAKSSVKWDICHDEGSARENTPLMKWEKNNE